MKLNKLPMIIIMAILLMAPAAVLASEAFNASGEITATGYVTIAGVTMKSLKGAMIETTGGAATVQFYNGSGGSALTPAISVADGSMGYFAFDDFHVVAASGIYVTITNAVIVVYCSGGI
jgi:hypothetical protein